MSEAVLETVMTSLQATVQEAVSDIIQCMAMPGMDLDPVYAEYSLDMSDKAVDRCIRDYIIKHSPSMINQHVKAAGALFDDLAAGRMTVNDHYNRHNARAAAHLVLAQALW